MTEQIMNAIPGALQFADWFGGWPSFHDAEILDLTLARNGPSKIRLHTWRLSGQVDSKGHYVADRHVVVTFWLEGVNDLQLEGFSPQNVISSLDLKVAPSGYRLCLYPCYGLAGEIEAQDIGVTFEPGCP